MRSVSFNRPNYRFIPAAIAAVALLIGLTAPVDARRGATRAKASHAQPAARSGGGYSPPYAAMVVDVKTGRTLHAVNEDALRHPASITKVMTLYMLFEQLERGRFQLDSPLTITANAAAQAPSKLGLRPGSTIEVEEAILALVTKSANDVACAIGENIAGSEPKFAEMMTRKAQSLGMSRTNYANASGLPDADQITTARDLTILARAIQDRFPRYFRYFQSRNFAFRGRNIGNHNRLLGRIEGVDGIKTGYTRDSGFNLMTSAKLDGRQIVAIVLGGKSGASRDAIMADLVRNALPRAYAGARQTGAVVETAERGRPAVIAEPAARTRTASAAPEEDDDIATTSSTSIGATTTPGMRSKGASQPMPAAAQAYSGTAGQAPFPAGAKSGARLPAYDGAVAKIEPPARIESKAEPAARVVTPTAWVIQLGAMDDEDKAKAMLSEARTRTSALSRAAPYTVRVTHAGATLFRARFSGFSEQTSAQDACVALKKNGFNCFATRS